VCTATATRRRAGEEEMMAAHERAHDHDRLEAVRRACLRAAADAYEDAGIRGLCVEGRWEAALDAVRVLDLRAIVDKAQPTDEDGILRLKRIYDPSTSDDGLRILVDRLWPRGLRRDDAEIDVWMPDVAPSTPLRKWFGHVLPRWTEFSRRYEGELDTQPEAVDMLAEHVRERRRVTLLFAARDVEHNHAVVLRAYLLQRASNRSSRKNADSSARFRS
jgi:uncharacterized protein YeaO (DUF488 family)